MDTEQQTEMSAWMIVGTWDTRTEADVWEAAAIQLGFYAKIVPVSAFPKTRIARP